MTTNMSTLIKSSIALLALFAALGAAIFFTNGASAQTPDADATAEQAGQRRGNRGDRTPLTSEELAEAVANGDITQERADAIEARTELRAISAEVFDKDAMELAVAEALGVSVEEMQAAKEDGTMQELMDSAGLTREDIQAIVEAEKAAQLAAAVADGTITQEQADALSEGSGKRGGRGHGKSGNGRGGRNGAPSETAAEADNA